MIEAGTVATFVLLLDSDTIVPLAGAAALRFTVPVEALPPVTVVGFTATDCSTTEPVPVELAGETVSVADCVTPFNNALIVTGVDADTAVVVTLNAALVEPAATVTEAGTGATAVSPLESETTSPAAGAACSM